MFAIGTLSASLLWASSSGTGLAQASWCSPPRPVPGVAVAPPRDDVEFTFLSPTQFARAIHRLSRHPVIPLSARAFRRLAKNGAIPPAGRYLYLARAGVMAPANLSDRDLPAYAERAGYYASVSTSREVLNIASLITSPDRQTPRNLAILVSSPTPITDVVVGCGGGR